MASDSTRIKAHFNVAWTVSEPPFSNEWYGQLALRAVAIYDIIQAADNGATAVTPGRYVVEGERDERWAPVVSHITLDQGVLLVEAFEAVMRHLEPITAFHFSDPHKMTEPVLQAELRRGSEAIFEKFSFALDDSKQTYRLFVKEPGNLLDDTPLKALIPSPSAPTNPLIIGCLAGLVVVVSFRYGPELLKKLKFKHTIHQ